MVEETKKNLQVKYDAVTETGVYSNAISVTSKKQEMVIDFGYIIPNINPPTIKIVSRINVTHETAENLLKMLSNAVLDNKNRENPKPKKD